VFGVGEAKTCGDVPEVEGYSSIILESSPVTTTKRGTVLYFRYECVEYEEILKVPGFCGTEVEIFLVEITKNILDDEGNEMSPYPLNLLFIYCPSGKPQSHRESVINYIHDVYLKGKSFLLLGDFNIDLLRKQNRSYNPLPGKVSLMLSDMLRKDLPTNNTGNTGTLIDHIWISNEAYNDFYWEASRFDKTPGSINYHNIIYSLLRRRPFFPHHSDTAESDTTESYSDSDMDSGPPCYSLL
jgi:hypothetical protein